MKKVLDLFSLSGKAAFVTGGAKGLGTSINEGLLEAGVNSLFFCGRGRHGSINDEEKRLKEKFPGVQIKGFICDVSNEEQLNHIVKELKNYVKYLDILICNAGVTWAAPTSEQTLQSWSKVIDTNLTGSFLVVREFSREFIKSNPNGGTIILISSLLALQGTAIIPQIGYTASKSALLGLTRQLAVEWAPQIRVNSIVPSFFEGIDSMAQMFTVKGSPVRDSLIEMIPLRRFINPSDLKAAICYLGSEASAAITGQYLVLDGGLSVK